MSGQLELRDGRPDVFAQRGESLKEGSRRIYSALLAKTGPMLLSPVFSLSAELSVLSLLLLLLLLLLAAGAGGQLN